MNRARFLKLVVAVLVTLLSAVVLFNLPQVIPPNDEKTSAKILPGANVDFESIDDAARNLPVVVDESYAKERMIDTKTNDVIEPMFTKSEVEEDSFMKKSDFKQLKKEAMKTPLYAEVSKISITDEESKVLKPEVSDNNDENIFKQDIKNEENFNMHSKYDSTCGYQNCPTGKDGFINVHLVAHSHDDVGWLNTVEQYYSGSTNYIHNVSVAKIIDSVVDELQVDPSRRFIYAEMAFFQRWWNNQNEERRNIVRNLVANGRLEFINGGWCMNDEATTHYVDIIDQMSLGLNFLNDTFGECGRPRIAWQIDPFGHSKEHASLMAQMGFDGMFLSRIDYQDFEERKKSKNMETVWASNNMGVDGKLFTGLLFNHYIPPKGFCFDEKTHRHCHDEPISERDASESVNEFLKYCQNHADSYRTNNILVTMGHDFTYQNAATWFTPMDSLIKYANKLQETGSKFNLFYSTPSCYAKAVNSHGLSWSTKTDDFFPHGSEFDAYWTGYFTSRPALKYMVRQGSNLLQSCKQMASYLSMKSHELVGSLGGDISVMKEAISVMQHHDAVTGTEQQHVADDYARLIHLGVEECQKIQNEFYQNEMAKISDPYPTSSYCNLNISQCDATEKANRFVINVYNSLASNIDKYIRVPVVKHASAYQVLDPNGELIPSDLMPIAEYVKNLPGRESSATHELVFLASQLPPLGSKSYYVEAKLSGESNSESFPLPTESISGKDDGKLEDTEEVVIPKQNFKKTFKVRRVLEDKSTITDEKSIANERISVQMDDDTGLIRSVLIDGEQIDLKQEFLWYAGKNPGNIKRSKGSRGLKNKINKGRPSGAYLFRPNQTDPFPLTNSDTGVTNTIYKGKLVEEIHQSYNDWVGQTIRLYKGQDHIELDWVVGSIPVGDGVGKEIITRFTSRLNSKKEFYTDANGRQILKRKIDARESFQYNNTEPVAGNYYPVNSQIFLNDQSESKQLTVLVDRAQGGASLNDGQLELMVHRRVLHDDGFGVQEALNETAFGVGLAVRGTHFLLLSGIAESAKLARPLSQQLYKQPQVSFVKTDLSFQEWAEKYNTESRILENELPENINILSLESRPDGKYLLRLEHCFDIGEDPKLSKPVTVNLKSLFIGFTVSSAEETMLAGNQLKKDSKRLIWKESDQTKQQEILPNSESFIDLEKVLLNPMEIRSFILSLKQN